MRMILFVLSILLFTSSAFAGTSCVEILKGNSPLRDQDAKGVIVDYILDTYYEGPDSRIYKIKSEMLRFGTFTIVEGTKDIGLDIITTLTVYIEFFKKNFFAFEGTIHLTRHFDVNKQGAIVKIWKASKSGKVKRVDDGIDNSTKEALLLIGDRAYQEGPNSRIRPSIKTYNTLTFNPNRRKEALIKKAHASMDGVVDKVVVEFENDKIHRYLFYIDDMTSIDTSTLSLVEKLINQNKVRGFIYIHGVSGDETGVKYLYLYTTDGHILVLEGDYDWT